jgi:hypothetical protein
MYTAFTKAISHHKLSTAQWMSLLNDLPLFELATFNNGHPNARDACDRILFSSRGIFACKFQTVRLNQMLFAEYDTISRIKNDDETKRIWIQLIQACISDISSSNSHQLSCLIFRGELLGIDPLPHKNANQALVGQILLSSSDQYDTFILYYASKYPSETYDIIVSHKEEMLYQRIGEIFFAVDEPTRTKIVKKLLARLRIIAAEPAQSLHNHYHLYSDICSAMLNIRNLLEPEDLHAFITYLGGLIEVHANTFTARAEVACARITLATLKGLNPSIQFLANNAFLFEKTCLIEHARTSQISSSLEILKGALTSSNDVLINQATSVLSDLCFRLKQNELVDIAKIVTHSIHDRDLDDHDIYLLQKLIYCMNDESIVTLHEYILDIDEDSDEEYDTESFHMLLQLNGSLHFLAKISNHLEQEDLNQVLEKMASRAIMMENPLPADIWKKLSDEYMRLPPKANQLYAAALTFNLHTQEPALRSRLIDDILYSCKHIQREPMDALRYHFGPLIRCLSFMTDEEHLKATISYCEECINNDAYDFAMHLIKELPGVNDHALNIIETFTLTRHSTLVRHALSSEKALRKDMDPAHTTGSSNRLII